LLCASILKIGKEGCGVGLALWRHDWKRVNFASNVMKLGEVDIMNISMIEYSKKLKGLVSTSFKFYNIVI
jgi:hypothetical protein